MLYTFLLVCSVCELYLPYITVESRFDFVNGFLGSFCLLKLVSLLLFSGFVL